VKPLNFLQGSSIFLWFLIIFLTIFLLFFVYFFLCWFAFLFLILEVLFPLNYVCHFLCYTSLGVYAVIIAVWFSNSNYSLLGGLLSVAQTISYEVSSPVPPGEYKGSSARVPRPLPCTCFAIRYSLFIRRCTVGAADSH
jgi:hypothetical protein